MAGLVQQVAQPDVQSIELREHRVWKWAPVIGGGAGLGSALVFIELVRGCGGCGVRGAPVIWVLFTAIGTGAGAGISSAHGQTRLVYWAPSKTLSFAPILLRSRQGLEVRISF